MSKATPGGPRALSVSLSPEPANVIIYTNAFEVVAEAEHLNLLPVSGQPRDLLAISVRCAQISRLTPINDQLGWRTQRTPQMSRSRSPPATSFPRAGVETTAEGRIRFPDAQLEPFAFDQAAQAIRATLGAAAP